MYVKKGSTMSSKFHTTNIVRQSSVLSPLLINVYVNDPIVNVCINLVLAEA